MNRRAKAYVWQSTDTLTWQIGFENVHVERPTWREAYDYAYQLIRLARIVRGETSGCS